MSPGSVFRLGWASRRFDSPASGPIGDAAHAPRAGWFAGYDPQTDQDAWAEPVETADRER